MEQQSREPASSNYQKKIDDLKAKLEKHKIKQELLDKKHTEFLRSLVIVEKEKAEISYRIRLAEGQIKKWESYQRGIK